MPVGNWRMIEVVTNAASSENGSVRGHRWWPREVVGALFFGTTTTTPQQCAGSNRPPLADMPD